MTFVPFENTNPPKSRSYQGIRVCKGQIFIPMAMVHHFKKTWRVKVWYDKEKAAIKLKPVKEGGFKLRYQHLAAPLDEIMACGRYAFIKKEKDGSFLFAGDKRKQK